MRIAKPLGRLTRKSVSDDGRVSGQQGSGADDDVEGGGHRKGRVLTCLRQQIGGQSKK